LLTQLFSFLTSLRFEFFLKAPPFASRKHMLDALMVGPTPLFVRHWKYSIIPFGFLLFRFTPLCSLLTQLHELSTVSPITDLWLLALPTPCHLNNPITFE